MVQCLSCEKWIHASCDHIDREDYQKYNSKDLPYICPRCKPKKGSLQLLVRLCIQILRSQAALHSGIKELVFLVIENATGVVL